MTRLADRRPASRSRLRTEEFSWVNVKAYIISLCKCSVAPTFPRTRATRKITREVVGEDGDADEDGPETGTGRSRAGRSESTTSWAQGGGLAKTGPRMKAWPWRGGARGRREVCETQVSQLRGGEECCFAYSERFQTHPTAVVPGPLHWVACRELQNGSAWLAWTVPYLGVPCFSLSHSTRVSPSPWVEAPCAPLGEHGRQPPPSE